MLELFYVFTNLFTVWLTRRQLDSHICFYFPFVISQVTWPLERPVYSHKRMKVKNLTVSKYFYKNIDLTDFLKGSQEPRGHFENWHSRTFPRYSNWLCVWKKPTSKPTITAFQNHINKQKMPKTSIIEKQVTWNLDRRSEWYWTSQ